MRTRFLFLCLGVAAAAALGSCGKAEDVGTPAQSLEAYLSAMHVEGMDPAVLRTYDVKERAKLPIMLTRADWAPHRGNVVLALGMTARPGEADPRPLQELLESSSTEALSFSAYEARQAVLLSLGHMVFYTSSQGALDYLVELSLPSGWRDEQLDWRTPYGEGRDFMRGHLARLAILGLSLSGTMEGLERIVAIEDGTADFEGSIDTEFRTAVDDLLDEARVRVKERIQERKVLGLR